MMIPSIHTECFLLFFFFNDTATTEIYTLSLHDALPILCTVTRTQITAFGADFAVAHREFVREGSLRGRIRGRSEEHTSELQSQSNLVCRLLLEKKKKTESTQDQTPYLTTQPSPPHEAAP